MKIKLLISLLIGILIGMVLVKMSPEPKKPQPVIAISPARSDRTVEVVQKTIASVVNISTTEIYKQSPLYRPDPFFDFFNQFFPRERDYEAKSLGSGVIIDRKGYVLTNEHIILSAKSVITITLNDGREFKGILVKSSPRFDIALIKIGEEGDEFPTAVLGDSDTLMVGETVIAIGSPYSFSQTVTRGIISAKDRTIRTDSGFQRDLIQTDASINPGNSGGPLLNLDGEVIAINTAIYSETGGSIGIGFALPINKATRILEEFLARKDIYPTYIGAKVQDMNQRLKRMFNVRNGVIITRIVGNSPADKAGLKMEDVILEIDKTPINDMDDYYSIIATFTPGETINIRVVRDGNEKNMNIKTIELTIDMAEDLAWELLGFTVTENTEQARSKYGLNLTQGLIINKVRKKSTLGMNGLKPGNILLKINGTSMATVEDFHKTILKISGNESAILHFYADGYYIKPLSVPFY